MSSHVRHVRPVTETDSRNTARRPTLRPWRSYAPFHCTPLVAVRLLVASIDIPTFQTLPRRLPCLPIPNHHHHFFPHSRLHRRRRFRHFSMTSEDLFPLMIDEASIHHSSRCRSVRAGGSAGCDRHNRKRTQSMIVLCLLLCETIDGNSSFVTTCFQCARGTIHSRVRAISLLQPR
jgi:hypothetical protein